MSVYMYDMHHFCGILVISKPFWILNLGPSECLPTELLEPLGRGTVGKLYIATKPTSSTCQ